MKFSRLLGVVLLALLTVTGMAWAGGKSESASASTSGTGGLVPFKAIILKHPLTKDVNTMLWLQKIEKKAGVTVKWQQITSDWPQKKGTMLASGDIPDMIFGAGAITDSDFSQFPGLFQSLNELIAKDGPNVQKMFAEHPELKAIATQLNGNIYGLPKYQRYWPLTVTRQMINKQWLEKLHLQVPKTWDQLFNVLMAFKTKDPNGDGKADEIPMDWAPGMGFFNVLTMLGGYGITLSGGVNGGFWVDNGTVKNFFVDPRYKDLVNFLHKCYVAGLINPNVFTDTYTQYQAITRNPEAPMVGFTYGWDLTDRFGAKWASQYMTTAPLIPSSSYNGKVTWDYSYDVLNYGADMVEMSAKAQHKDVAMKFIDEFYNPIVSMQVLFGSIGPNIKDNGNGTYTVLPPKDPQMDPGTWKWTSTWADDGPMYISDSLKLTLGADMQALAREDKILDPVLHSINPKKDVWPGVFIKFSAADNNQLALLNTNVNNLTLSNFANWVVKGGIDAQWDNYVKNVNKAGMPQILKIMQKYYDSYSQN